MGGCLCWDTSALAATGVDDEVQCHGSLLIHALLPPPLPLCALSALAADPISLPHSLTILCVLTL